MEPLTALSLAGNVLQFVDFGCKLLSRTGEVYQSSIGSLEINDEIELVTADLRALIRKLRQSFLPWDNGKMPTQEDLDTLLSFRRICDNVAKVAEELVGRLNKLDPNTEHRRLRSLQHAIKGLWNESEIASLIRRLSTLREALESHVLFSIRQSLTAETARTCTRFDTLDREAQQILITVLESTSNTEKKLWKEFRDGMDALTITVSQLIGRFDLTSEDSRRVTRKKIVKRTCERQGIDWTRAIGKYMLHAFLPKTHTEEELWTFVDDANTILQGRCEDTGVQLTARCAGFVEASNKEGNISPKSHVQYFHRTARDFLETEENWSKLLLHTSNTIPISIQISL
ncbi:hypothetical protein DL98DRAFT_655557 [Cadophora sp. DSE1049]|nr:hypothetical protein DL98DRAFT_655557 [Cadophora sp. DSE1049]